MHRSFVSGLSDQAHLLQTRFRDVISDASLTIRDLSKEICQWLVERHRWEFYYVYSIFKSSKNRAVSHLAERIELITSALSILFPNVLMGKEEVLHNVPSQSQTPNRSECRIDGFKSFWSILLEWMPGVFISGNFFHRSWDFCTSIESMQECITISFQIIETLIPSLKDVSPRFNRNWNRIFLTFTWAWPFKSIPPEYFDMQVERKQCNISIIIKVFLVSKWTNRSVLASIYFGFWSRIMVQFVVKFLENNFLKVLSTFLCISETLQIIAKYFSKSIGCHCYRKIIRSGDIHRKEGSNEWPANWNTWQNYGLQKNCQISE